MYLCILGNAKFCRKLGVNLKVLFVADSSLHVLVTNGSGGDACQKNTLFRILDSDLNYPQTFLQLNSRWSKDSVKTELSDKACSYS